LARVAQGPRLSAEPNGIEAEVMKRAEALVRKEAGLSYAEALSEVFSGAPELYTAYTQQGDTEPTADRPPSVAPAPVGKAPTEKGMSAFIPPSLQYELMKTAAALSPGDYQKGMKGIEAALQEIRGWAAEQEGAA
jgi:hypothetical protein